MSPAASIAAGWRADGGPGHDALLLLLLLLRLHSLGIGDRKNHRRWVGTQLHLPPPGRRCPGFHLAARVDLLVVQMNHGASSCQQASLASC